MNDVSSSPKAPEKKSGKRFVYFYIAFLIIALSIIELRLGWFWHQGGVFSRVPLAHAVFNWMFVSDKMQYVASSPLRKGQQITRADLAVDPQIQTYLVQYLPSLESRIGKFVKADVEAGKPIIPNNLDSNPAIMAETNSYVIFLRVSGLNSQTNFLKPQMKVVLSASNWESQVEAVVITGNREQPRMKVPDLKKKDSTGSEGATNDEEERK